MQASRVSTSVSAETDEGRSRSGRLEWPRVSVGVSGHAGYSTVPPRLQRVTGGTPESPLASLGIPVIKKPSARRG
jgi:hypothetical protein